MSLRNNIIKAVTSALKEGKKEEAQTLRFLMAEIKNREIEKKKREEGLNDEEVLEVIMSQAKKRRDAIAEFKKAEREDLVQKEQGELDVLNRYLPEQMNEEEITKEVKAAIEQTGAKGPADIGKVMAIIMLKLKGRADGQKINERTRQLLG